MVIMRYFNDCFINPTWPFGARFHTYPLWDIHVTIHKETGRLLYNENFQSFFTRADSMFASSQWETVLLCSDDSHWLGASIGSALYTIYIYIMSPTHVTEVGIPCVILAKSCSLIGATWRRHQLEIFSTLLDLCAGIHRSPVNSPHKGQWRGALMHSLICTWINGWVNNREAGDLRRRRSHYNVIVMR